MSCGNKNSLNFLNLLNSDPSDVSTANGGPSNVRTACHDHISQFPPRHSRSASPQKPSPQLGHICGDYEHSTLIVPIVTSTLYFPFASSSFLFAADCSPPPSRGRDIRPPLPPPSRGRDICPPLPPPSRGRDIRPQLPPPSRGQDIRPALPPPSRDRDIRPPLPPPSRGRDIRPTLPASSASRE